MSTKASSDDTRYIGVGSVSLYVNRNANIWSEAIMYLSRTTRAVKDNYNDSVPVQVIVVYIVPGFQNPVEFSGTRITMKSRKGPKRVQVEAAIPDVPFPEDNPEKAKEVILHLMLDAVKDVEVYAKKNRIIEADLEGARNVIRKLWDEWNMSDFRYNIPEGLPYFDFPKVKGLTARRFIEQLAGGGVRHYDMVLDENGNEVP